MSPQSECATRSSNATRVRDAEFQQRMRGSEIPRRLLITTGPDPKNLIIEK